MDKKTIISLILVILWMGVIFYLSDMDTNESNKKSTSIVTTVVGNNKNNNKSNKVIKDTNTIFRKICHGLEYLALAVLSYNFVIRVIKKNIYVYSAICTIFCFVYGIIDEYHQTFINGRTGQFTDVLIDTLGAVIGCVIISIIYNHYKKNRVAYE